ncbi:MAG: DEAD/DEAH box helicase, partial [Pseudomonadota bacterium]
MRVISGKLDIFRDQYQITHPDFIEKHIAAIPGIEPRYPLTKGISNKMMCSLMAKALSRLPDLPEWLRDDVIHPHHWRGFSACLRLVHNPQQIPKGEDIYSLRERLAYDELLANQLALLLTRRKQRKRGRAITCDSTLADAMCEQLPFTLSEDQQTAIGEIRALLQDEVPMLHLLQGDVGAGKTLVALVAMLDCVQAGYQAAIMVPSQLVAEQHHQLMQKLLAPLGVTVVLLCGSVTAKQRRENLQKLAYGDAQLVVGTHALFQEAVHFANLHLLVIDEQHRF